MGRLVHLRPDLRERLFAGGKLKWEVAKGLGIAEGTLDGLLDGSWTVIDRRLMERLIDELGCGPGDLFDAIESPFFSNIAPMERHRGTHA